MAQTIWSDGLLIDVSKWLKNHKGPVFFNDTLSGSGKDRQYSYKLPQKIEVKGLKTASGEVPRISTNPKMAKAIKVQGL